MELSGKLSQIINVVLLIGVMVLTSGCRDEEEDDVIVSRETGSLMDVDGNIYKTVKIGEQWWMVENLKVKRFRNGNAIKNGQSDGIWTDSTPAYCIYQDISTAPGLLYNWHAVNDTSGLAPDGWHIPTDEDWKVLETYLGMNTDEAGKTGWRGNGTGEMLKVEGTQGWNLFEGTWATNESGFSAFGGSCRMPDAIWGYPGLKSTGFWWSASSFHDNKSWYRHLDYKNSGVFRFNGSHNYGMSVRCIMNS